MAPTRVGIGESLALAPALRDESLTVRECGHVRPVNGHVYAHLRQLGVEGSGQPVKAGVKQGLEAAQLDREAAARVDARHVAPDGGAERVMLAD